MTDPFPRQFARTRGFDLGLPRAFSIAPDGSRVAFLRSAGGADPLTSLWVLDVATQRERIVFRPGTEEGITGEERDRRERAGERLTGVVTYACDQDLRIASFALGERLMVSDLLGGETRALDGAGVAFDPRPDPTGRRVAYVADGALHVWDLDADADHRVAYDEDPDVQWGTAEFIAAEEMERSRGYWWSPDGERLLSCRVDERPVQIWHISSPIDPSVPARPVRYPRAGTANAIVTLHVVALDGTSVEIRWDREGYEYVVAVSWTVEGPPLALVQSRDQRRMQALAIDPDTGATEVVWEDRDPIWTDITPGTPAWLPGGGLLTAGHRDDSRCLLIDDEPVTPPGLQIASVIGVGDVGDAVTFAGTTDPTQMHVWRRGPDGSLDRLTGAPGVHKAVVESDMAVVISHTMEEPLPTAVLSRAGEALHTFGHLAETPCLIAKPEFMFLGSREIRAVLFTPGGREPDEPLPVLLDPYGGPGFARVIRAQRAHLESQWFADQGFVVVVADGRGTPGRGATWEQSVHLDYVDAALDDQVDALQSAADRLGYLDLGKVAIRGWSYGGYLTLASLLRRPEVFHAGIAGAPNADPAFYDTHYMERYLGTPDAEPAAYERANVVKDAAGLQGELLLIHGFADDNVYVTHALQMSKALMEAGRRHSMIPLSGITHRPTDEHAAEAMLMIEVDFLRRSLGLEGAG
ncbi:MAG: prolyl oligopeptidase family serine peptidase [Actinomycetota bacterium]